MPRRTQHQLIWRSTKNGAELRLPKIITTDVGFQLMFGEAESYIEDVANENRNANNYECKVYRDLQHIKSVV